MVKVSKTPKSESSYTSYPKLINCMGNSWPDLVPKKGKSFPVQYLSPTASFPRVKSKEKNSLSKCITRVYFLDSSVVGY